MRKKRLYDANDDETMQIRKGATMHEAFLGENITVTPTVAAICRDACEKFVNESGQLTRLDPEWAVMWEVMVAFHRFARIAGYRPEVEA